MTDKTLDEKSIFQVAVEIAAPEIRADYLRQVCGDDVELFERVVTLLRMQDEQPSFLELPAEGVGNFDTPPLSEKPGDLIGPYKLIEQIGEGGMGVVYMAEQKRPVKRTVALKIIKPGMDTKEVAARFEAERQALALMSHPNVAKVLDAGETEAGRPYFVMELVKGIPITEFCNQRKLDSTQRLKLFATVCQAVQHAHQKGIIHRDLKPTNILVELHDVTAVPKVIDFGVAKAVTFELTERSLHTGFSQMIGTPLYMSPEQAELSGLDVDTRSDIYSLGVLLYELLTGTTPFPKETLQQAGYDEMRRIIREDDPPRPSRRVSTLAADALTTTSEQHGCDPRRFSRTLRGDPDWIVMKAMEKDRSRRYESAAALDSDIGRYLSDEPVVARPPTTTYQLQKFVRRHRGLVASLAMVFASLGVGVAMSLAAMNVAKQQAADAIRAQEGMNVAMSMVEEVFDASPRHVESERRTVRQAMEELAEGLGERLKGYPEAEISLRRIFAGNYRRTADQSKARMHLHATLTLAKDLYGEEHKEVADAYVALAEELIEYGDEPNDDIVRLGSYAQKALNIYEKLGLRTHKTSHAWYCKSQSLVAPKEQTLAEECLRNALTIADELPENTFQQVHARLDYGRHLHQLGSDRLDVAHKLFREALERSKRLTGDQRTLTASILRDQGNCYRRQGNPEAAINCFRKAWGIFSDNPGLRQEPRGHRCAWELAELYLLQDHAEAARNILREVEQISAKHGLNESLAECHFFRGWIHFRTEEYQAAEEAFRHVLELADGVLHDRHPTLGYSLFYLAEVLRRLNRLEEARAYYHQIVPYTEDYIKSGDHLRVVNYAHTVSVAYSGDASGKALNTAIDGIDEALRDAAAFQRPWQEPHLLLAKALALRELKRDEEAVAALEVGLAKCGQLPTAVAIQAVGLRHDIPISCRELKETLSRFVAESPRGTRGTEENPK